MLALVLAVVLGVVDRETGLPVEGAGPGYAPGMDAAPFVLGQGEWTGNGPWGGNVKALAASPGDNDLVLAACGFSMASDAGGVWRSADGGLTWESTGLFGIQVNDACAAPDSKFYAATRTGLYVSEDGGVTWSTVSGMPSSYVIGIGVSPADPNLLIAGLAGNTGIRRSADGGATWEEVGLSTGFMKGFGCDPDHPDTMYVAMSGLSRPLYRSTDGGASWSPMGPEGSGWGLLVAPFGTGETIILTHSDGFYVSQDHGATWDLAVSGGSYAPAVCDGENLYAPVNSAAGVYESTDGGQTWNLNTSGIVASYWQAGCASSAGYLAGHYGGVYRTPGPGETYAVSQQGIGNTFIHAVAYSASTGTLFAGGEYHGLWRSSDQGANWDIVFPGPGNWTIYDIQPRSDLHYQGPVMYMATAGGVYRSDDHGDSWAPAGFQGTQVTAVAFDPGDPDRAWAGTAAAGVHYTTDGGRTWTAGSGLPFALYPSIELMDVPDRGLRILVSFQQSGTGVYRSDDGGAAYTAVPVPGSYHPGLSARWGDDPAAYLATDGGIYRSWDRGETWEPCPGSSGLSWAVLGERNEHVFNATGSNGVVWSPDQGNTWQPLNTGIEGRCVWDLTYGATPAQLFAGLRGFGVVELTEDQLGIQGDTPGAFRLTASPNPSRGSVSMAVAGPFGGTVVLRVYDSAGRLAASLEDTGRGAVWIPEPGTPAGLYLIRASGSGRTATARVVLLPR